jgi:type I restriction enzyme, S subunit
MVVAVALASKVEDLEEPDGPWLLPDGWEWVPLKRLSSFIGRGRGPTYVASGGVPVVNQKCIRWRRLEPKHFKLTSRDAFDRLAPELHIRAGDLLWNSTGTGTIGRAVVYDGSIPELTIDSHVTLVRPTSVEPSYLGYFIETLRVQHLVIDGHVGSTNQQELPRSFVEELLVPVPPAAEQGRIVARVEALFAEIADGEAALVEARKGLDTFRRGLLKAAVTGELTKDWRAANPASETGHDLLARIAKDRATKAPAKGRRRRNVDAQPLDTSSLTELPEGWTWATVDEVKAGHQRNGISIPGTPSPPGVKAMRLDALTARGLNLDAIRYIPLPEDRIQDYRVNSGDLLISRANGSPEFVGRAVYVADIGETVVFPDTIIRYPLGADQQIGWWIELAWNSPFGRSKIRRLAKTTAGILKISQEDIAQIALPIPPSAEAAEILRRVSDALTAAADTLAMLDAEAADGARLKQSILKAAFEGHLVPQDPTDESASALLARLAANSPTTRAKRGRGAA